MNSLLLGVCLWFGLQDVTNNSIEKFKNFYKIDLNTTFYCDSKGKTQPLVFTGKLYVDKNKITSDYIAENKLLFEKHNDGIIIYINKEKYNKVVDDLLSKGILVHPIFLKDGNHVTFKRDYCPIYLKTKPFVTEDLLKNYLNEYYKYINIDFVYQKEYDLYVINLNTSLYNRLVIANALSEDSWVEWAHPGFDLLYDEISVKFDIDSKANVSIGNKRYLNVKITYYGDNIEITDDMIPVMGKEFNPMPFSNDNYLDANSPQITRKKYSDRTEIDVVYPFRYFAYYEKLFFKDIPFRYKVNGEDKVYTHPDFNYSLGLLTFKNGIKNIIVPNATFPIIVNYDQDQKIHLWYDTLDLFVVSFAFIIIGLVLIIVSIMKCAYGLFISLEKGNDDLKNLFDILNNFKNDNWKQSYFDIYSSFIKYINKFNINLTNFNEYPKVALIIKELNKIYQEDAKPEYENLKKLLQEFVKK